MVVWRDFIIVRQVNYGTVKHRFMTEIDTTENNADYDKTTGNLTKYTSPLRSSFAMCYTILNANHNFLAKVTR